MGEKDVESTRRLLCFVHATMDGDNVCSDKWITELLAGVDIPGGTTPKRKLTRDQRRFNWTLKHGVNAKKYANERALVATRKPPMDTTYRRIEGISRLERFKKLARHRIAVRGQDAATAVASAKQIIEADPTIKRMVIVIRLITPGLLDSIKQSGAPLCLGGKAPSRKLKAHPVLFWMPSWNPDYYPCTRANCTHPNMRTLHTVCVHCHTAVYCNERCRSMDAERHQAYECAYLAYVCTTPHTRRLHKYFPPSIYGTSAFHSPM